MHLIFSLIFILVSFFSSTSNALLNVGIGKSDITPTIGTPSAGYADRKGEGMKGVHDPLMSTAFYIDNGEKKIVLVSVDNLGFTYEMVQEVIRQVHNVPELKDTEIYIGSSHTHSGGGAFLNIPLISNTLAGPYDAEVTKFYVTQTAKAIIDASKNITPAKIGIGYGKAQNLSQYRSAWPTDVTLQNDVAVIKVTKPDGTPLALLFNFANHPTVLRSENRLFSADFVGYARDHLRTLIGNNVQPIYFNGAQGDINPVIFNEEDRFASSDALGRALAEKVKEIYQQIQVSDALSIKTEREPYILKPQPTPFGLKLPLEQYQSEMNILVLNKTHAFITIPGELSTIYDQRLKAIGKDLGYARVSIFGLTNDAHGYIILPESWRHRTFESFLSFGGENYGEETRQRAETLLKHNAPALP